MRKNQWLVLLCVLALVLALSVGCIRPKGGAEAQQGKPEQTTKVRGNANFEHVQALLEYAERLEEAGNDEAAARVYALIPKAVAGEAFRVMEEYEQSNGEISTLKMLRDTFEIYFKMEGGE